MNTEKLRLVTSFDELRAGMIVVVTCRRCASRHRGILVSLYTGEVQNPDNSIAFGHGWLLEPRPLCGLKKGFIASTVGVAGQRVYRVIDDDVTQVSRAVKRKREGVR